MLIFAGPAVSAEVETIGLQNKPLHVIAFGSCADQDHAQPIWKAVNAESADLFIFLGDNIYADTEDMDVMRSKYELLAANPGFAKLRNETPIIATWDDHDFGVNNGGAEYQMKEHSRDVMLDFWGEAEESPRRHQDDGIYASYQFGPEGQRIQIILLDLRWNRSPLHEVIYGALNPDRIMKDMGPFIPAQGPDEVLLGEAQWAWLEEQLNQPADIRIIGSSIQLVPEFSGWESWANFPDERRRLFSLLKKLGTNGVFVISGDTHWSEISRIDKVVDYSLWEITSSGLTEEWKKVSPNLHRVGDPYSEANYGLIEIDWELPDPQIMLSIKDVAGQTVMQQKIMLYELVKR